MAAENEYACIMTVIGRLRDGIEVCSSMEVWGDTPKGRHYQKQARDILSKLTHNSPPQCRLDCPPYYFVYHIAGGVIYLTLCAASYPQRLAFAFLQELAKEFDTQYGKEVDGVNRPYAFIKFDTFIQRTKKHYLDSSTKRSLDGVTQDLIQVQRVMTESLDVMLSRGEILSSVSKKSDDLLQKSAIFQTRATELNHNNFIKKYGILIGVVLFLSLLFYIYI